MRFEKVLAIQNSIVPEMSILITKRYNLLKSLKNHQPIGRRMLASKIGMTERVLRSEVEILKDLGLIRIESSGMRLSKAGEKLLVDTEELIYNMKGLKDLGNQLKEKMGIRKVSLVEGDSDDDDIIIKDMGKKASLIINSLIEDDMKIGIMGGTTMACVADEMEYSRKVRNIMVVPGRGGLGEKLEIQSNTIAAKLAHKLNAEYKLLHVPDNIQPELLEALKETPQIKSVLDEIKEIDMIVFGVGTAMEMAERRGMSELKKDELKIKNAVAEALGYYFDNNGIPIMHTDSVGIDLKDINSIKHVICIASGKNKAEAIYAFSKYYKDYILVTDEETAKEILKLN